MDPSTSAAALPIRTPIDRTLVRGAIELETGEHGVVPHRMPAWARRQASDAQLSMVEAQTSGVRLVFTTAATTIEIDAVRTVIAYRGAPARPAGRYELLADGLHVGTAESTGGHTLTIDMTSGTRELTRGSIGTVAFSGLPAGPKRVEIWLPFNEATELVALRADAPIEAVPETGRVWLHHGSSISHGSNTDAPTATWPAVAALASGTELINLGLGGSALLDPFAARTIRDTPADLISVKLGINLVNADLMRMRAFRPAVHGSLDTIRDGHPDTPLLVVSSIYCPIHEDTPGPLAPDFSNGQVRFTATGDPAEVAVGKLTLNVVREELRRIVAERAVDDPQLAYLDGRDLYGASDYDEFPLPDELHPDRSAHERIGRRFAERVFGPDGHFHPGR